MPKLTRYHLYTVRAYAVHLYTSLGLIAALLAMGALISGDIVKVLIFLGISMFIDSTDGTMARAWKVTTWASGVDGRKLDDITDYITYAFIPVVFAYRFGMVHGLGILVLCLVLIFGAYGFVRKTAKTHDGFFTGFPNFWNLLVFYLYIFHATPTANALIMLFFALMIFVPIKYVSYSTRAMRPLTVVMSLLYGLNLAAILWTWDAPDIRLRLAAISMIFPVYYTALSLYLHFKKEEDEVLFAK